VLANIGGYSGMVWMSVLFFISGYNQFKFDSAIVGQVLTYQ